MSNATAQRGVASSATRFRDRDVARRRRPWLRALVTVLVLAVVAGAVVVETVFAWPGVGRLLVDAALTRDFPILQFGVFVVAISVLLANYMIDVSYVILDPRTRSDQ